MRNIFNNITSRPISDRLVYLYYCFIILFGILAILSIREAIFFLNKFVDPLFHWLLAPFGFIALIGLLKNNKQVLGIAFVIQTLISLSLVFNVSFIWYHFLNLKELAIVAITMTFHLLLSIAISIFLFRRFKAFITTKEETKLILELPFRIFGSLIIGFLVVFLLALPLNVPSDLGGIFYFIFAWPTASIIIFGIWQLFSDALRGQDALKRRGSIYWTYFPAFLGVVLALFFFTGTGGVNIGLTALPLLVGVAGTFILRRLKKRI